MSTMANLLRHVLRTEGGCWLWTGALNNQGYAQIGDDGRIRSAHRVSYELHKGPIPQGLQIDHLCMTKRCINPAHLEAVTQSENQRRRFQDHCPSGHPYTIENTTYRKDRGTRVCKICRLATSKRRAKGYGKPGRPSKLARLALEAEQVREYAMNLPTEAERSA